MNEPIGDSSFLLQNAPDGIRFGLFLSKELPDRCLGEDCNVRKVNWLFGGLCYWLVFSQTSFWVAAPIPEQVIAPVKDATPSDLNLRVCPGEMDGVEGDRPPIGCPDFEETETNSMAQVRSIAELDDVRPSDWAYQALQSLIERYNVFTGYPDGTFRGNRPLTRHEFAAVLSQVFTKLEELFATGEIARIREDFSTLRRLQESYGSIATNLGTRLDLLDRRLGNRESQQFSTTTRLTGQSIAVITDGSGAPFTTVSRIRLNLQTSFSGNDLLLTQLEAGNAGGDAISRAQSRGINLLGTLGLLADGGGLNYVGVDRAVQVSKLHYTFQPTADLSLTVGTHLNPRDFIDYNRFANASDRNFASSFFMSNPLIVQNPVDRPGGAGAVVRWQPGGSSLSVKALYAATDADRTQVGITDGGLFGDRYQGSLELEYALNRDFVTRLQFTRAAINGVDIFAGGMNVEWTWNKQLAIFGRYGIGTYRGFNPFLGQTLDLTPQTWAIGTIVRNIVIPDSTAGLAIGQPFVTGDLGNATQTNVEGFYSFLLNENISFTPGLVVVTNPDNRRSSTVWEFYVRMVFSF